MPTVLTWRIRFLVETALVNNAKPSRLALSLLHFLPLLSPHF